jgi:hypothetical protein
VERIYGEQMSPVVFGVLSDLACLGRAKSTVLMSIFDNHDIAMLTCYTYSDPEST